MSLLWGAYCLGFFMLAYIIIRCAKDFCESTSDPWRTFWLMISSPIWVLPWIIYHAVKAIVGASKLSRKESKNKKIVQEQIAEIQKQDDYLTVDSPQMKQRKWYELNVTRPKRWWAGKEIEVDTSRWGAIVFMIQQFLMQNDMWRTNEDMDAMQYWTFEHFSLLGCVDTSEDGWKVEPGYSLIADMSSCFNDKIEKMHADLFNEVVPRLSETPDEIMVFRSYANLFADNESYFLNNDYGARSSHKIKIKLPYVSVGFPRNGYCFISHKERMWNTKGEPEYYYSNYDDDYYYLYPDYYEDKYQKYQLKQTTIDIDNISEEVT